MMKKTSLALALLAATTTAAWAQSSVTLYGIVDAAVRHTTNEGPAGDRGQSITRMIGGGMSQSRFGINITEDLGGGMKAIANLEHRFTTDNGSALPNPYPFWMQSWVGVQGSFGRVTVGRQYNVLFDLVTSTYVSYPYSPYFDAYKPEVGLALSARADNMIKYMAEIGPWRFGAQVSAGEGSTMGGKTLGGYLRYSANGISAGAGTQTYELPSGKEVRGTTFGASYRTGGWYFNAGYGVNKVDSGATAADIGVLNGVPLLWGSFANGGVGYNNTALALGANKRTLWTIGANYQITPQLNIGGHYYSGKQTGPGARLSPTIVVPGSAVRVDADFFTLAADYALSKRTDAYVEFDRTKLDGPNASLAGANGAPNGAKGRNGYTIGLRHRF